MNCKLENSVVTKNLLIFIEVIYYKHCLPQTAKCIHEQSEICGAN